MSSWARIQLDDAAGLWPDQEGKRPGVVPSLDAEV